MTTQSRAADRHQVRRILLVGACCAAGLGVAGAEEPAGGVDPQAAVLERLEAAEQPIEVLERRLELQAGDAARVAADAPQVRAGSRGAREVSRTPPGGTASFADPAVSVRRATGAGIGANWHLTPNVETVLDHEWTRVAGGAADGANRADEKALFTRFQVGF